MGVLADVFPARVMMAAMTGGDKLMAYMTTINARLAATGAGPSVQIGFLEGSRYPDGTSIPEIAFYNEFGVPSRKQPPRPFFRRMIKAKAPTWGADMAKVLKAAGYDVAVTLGRLGELIKGQLQQSIHDLVEPALAPSTIRAKGFDKPLIGGAKDSGGGGLMWNSVDYKVSA
jgi:hypothetical protein